MNRLLSTVALPLVALLAASALLLIPVASGRTTLQLAVPSQDAQAGIAFRVVHRPPGDLYAATFAAYGPDVCDAALVCRPDPYPYYLGYNAQTVRPDGSVWFWVDPGDLTAYKPQLDHVYVWLRPPGSRSNAPPVLDATGHPYARTIQFGSGY